MTFKKFLRSIGYFAFLLVVLVVIAGCVKQETGQKKAEQEQTETSKEETVEDTAPDAPITDDELEEPTEPGQTVCKNLCGNGICEEIVCQAIGCPCAETAESCPEDC